ncbi:neurogenic protein big brain [Neodiprion pinetum]|uniref:neurogenic protein big brain n=1 Tax=Neodiprion pinetum TaxID=441929 RepID=UPI001EDFA43D|nr:neurogenic protein big brain [Neodiprion pinetum]
MTTATLPRELDAHIVTLFERISALRDNASENSVERRPPMSVEARSLELWRAVAIECFATSILALVVPGAVAPSLIEPSTRLSALAVSIATGLAMASICLIFGHISGGHVNPAVSISFALSRRISPLRAALYLAAQCGGGIAGAAILQSVSPDSLKSQGWITGSIQKLLVELALSALVVLAHFAADTPRGLPASVSSKPAMVLAATYTTATLVSRPYLNPARALGVAFLRNVWSDHYVYWVGPISGGAVAALLHEYVLSPKRSKSSQESDDGDDSSVRSDEDPYDELDKATGPKFPSVYATYRPIAGAPSSIYSAPPTAIDRVESIYGGTKSLYCKSPPLTRANLNRSQSVYAKSTSGPRDGLVIPKPGPLMPAQSLYPMRIGQSSQGPRETVQTQSQNHNSTNQNMQNQLQQCTQSIYGIRGISTSISARENGIYGVSTTSSVYGRAPAPPPGTQNIQQTGNAQNSTPNHGATGLGVQGNPGNGQNSGQTVQNRGQHGHQNSPPSVISSAQNHPAGHANSPLATSSENGGNPRRPESMYGHVSRRSEDSAYGSYQGSARGNYGKAPGPPGPSQYRGERPSPGPLQQNQSQQSNFQRNSPNPSY